jgi:hypothetical protein
VQEIDDVSFSCIFKSRNFVQFGLPSEAEPTYRYTAAFSKKLQRQEFLSSSLNWKSRMPIGYTSTKGIVRPFELAARL